MRYAPRPDIEKMFRRFVRGVLSQGAAFGLRDAFYSGWFAARPVKKPKKPRK